MTIDWRLEIFDLRYDSLAEANTNFSSVSLTSKAYIKIGLIHY